MENNNNLTPLLRFPGFTGEWEEKKLGDITKNEDSKRRPIAKVNRETGTYPYYGANGVQDYIGDYIFDGDYLLVGEDGSVLTAENTPVINWASGKFWVNNHAHVLSQKEGTSLLYVSFVLSTIKIQGFVTGIPPKLNQENLNNIAVPIPSKLLEQEKVAHFLFEMDKLISIQNQKVDALKEKKKGLMQQLFPQPGETAPRLRFPEFEGDWTETTLGEMADKVNKRNSQLEVSRVFTNSATSGIIDQSDYFDRDIAVIDNTSNYHIVETGDFVYNPRISAAAPVGPISMNNLGRGIMSPLYMVFRFHSGDNSFFEQYYQTTIWHPYLKSIANYGARFDRMNITTEGFFNMPLLVPSPSEQQKIASCLSEMDTLIVSESSKLEGLKSHKRGLMQQLFPQTAK